MRLFIALDIDDSHPCTSADCFMDGVRGFAPEARWVFPESMHVTLKFIGEKSAEEVEEIKQALSGVRAGAFEISFRGYGFFPTSNSPRVFWLGVAAGPQLGRSWQSRWTRLCTGTRRSRRKSTSSVRISLWLAGGGSGAPRRRKRRRSKFTFPAFAGEIGGDAGARLWYDDRPGVLSIRKSAWTRRVSLHKNCTLLELSRSRG